MTVTTLLISSNASLTESVRRAVQSIRDCELRVVQEIDDALLYLKRDGVALVLGHLADEADEKGVARLLREFTIARRPVATVVLSDRHCPRQELRLLRLGVADYLASPVDLERLAFLTDVLTVRARYCGVPGSELEAAELSQADDDPFLYRSAEMRRIVQQVRRVAPLDTTILLTGQTGTGKTRLASLIHELSPRRDQPFRAVDCGALSASLIESELFGHVKGAFTGADRDRVGRLTDVGTGTLLLDDIDALPLAVQTKFLRTIEERVFEPVGSNEFLPIQARLIAASNRLLEDEVAAGRFRADLYYRLNVVAFQLPALCDCRPGIRGIAEKFIAEFAARNDRPVQGLTAAVVPALEAYDWPGNIRELRNVIERAVALCAGPLIDIGDLPDAIRCNQRLAAVAGMPVPETRSSLARTKRQAEIGHILDALQEHGNNRVRTARALGISRVSLYKKLHKYGLQATA